MTYRGHAPPNKLNLPDVTASSLTSRDLPFPNVFTQSWNSHVPANQHRRGSIDRPWTPARVRHYSNSRRLSLYENNESPSSDEDGGRGKRRHIGLKSSLKVCSVGDDEFYPSASETGSALNSSNAFSTSRKSVSLEIPCDSAKEEENPRRSSLDAVDDSPYEIHIDININTRTSCSGNGILMRKKKDNFVEADSKHKRRKSLPNALKVKRNSLPNLQFLKHIFIRPTVHHDNTEIPKEKKTVSEYQRRQSLPESKIKEQALSKLGIRTRKTSSSSQSSSSHSPSLGSKLQIRKTNKGNTCSK